jgi:hypothetical protein
VRLSELLASTVVDAAGAALGPVRDVRLIEREPGVGGMRFGVAGIVVGKGLLAGPAHAWGYAEGRAQGPWLLRVLMRPAVRQARFVAADQVTDWGPRELRISVRLADLPALEEVVEQ